MRPDCSSYQDYLKVSFIGTTYSCGRMDHFRNYRCETKWNLSSRRVIQEFWSAEVDLISAVEMMIRYSDLKEMWRKEMNQQREGLSNLEQKFIMSFA